MGDYRITTTEISLHPIEMDPLSHRATSVQLSGTREAGYFIRIEQEDQCIELDPEELSPLMAACRQLLQQMEGDD
jgi:hypothetical protein